MKFKDWDETDLKGRWLFTIKIDGVQCRRHRRRVLSKNEKPLYNFPADCKRFRIAEVFCGSWNETMSIVRASKSPRRKIKNDEIYTLYPRIDERLRIGWYVDPTKEQINQIFQTVVKQGFEGLVIRQGETFIKVKTVYTDDIIITGAVEGKGKFKGMLGKFTSDSGDCGVGFTHAQRKEYWIKRGELVATYMEVKSMERTKTGKLRNPRFVRLRPDK